MVLLINGASGLIAKKFEKASGGEKIKLNNNKKMKKEFGMNLKEKEMSSKFDVKICVYIMANIMPKNVNMKYLKNRLQHSSDLRMRRENQLFLKTLNRPNDLVEGCKITGDISSIGEKIYMEIWM